MAKLTIGWLLVICAVLIACGPETIVVRPSLDTPSHHIANGDSLLDQGKPNDAYREFKRANELAPNNVEALIGLAKSQIQRGELESGKSVLEQAKRVATTDQERIAIQEEYRQLKGINPALEPLRSH